MHATFVTIVSCVFWFSLLAFGYSYIVYPVVLRLLSWRFGSLPSPKSQFKPSVAVVMPVYNEEKVIGAKLDNILSLDYPAEKLTIWIGSDRSSDRTEAIIRERKEANIRLWVAPERSGKTGILNQLVPQIDAELLVFTDADIMFDRDSVRVLVNHFANPEVGGVGGLTLQRSPDSVPGHTEEVTYRRFEAMQKQQESLLHSTISAFGSFYAIRKSLFVPFHRHTYSNDDVMMPMNIIRQGYRMLFDPQALSYETQNAAVGIEFKRRVRIGAGNFQAFFWLLDFLDPRKGWPWFCYVSHKVSRWFSPFFLGLAMVSCGLLGWADQGTVYKIFCALGVIFGVSSLLHRVIPLPILRHIFYFLAMNLAIIFGFFKFLRGIRTAAWSRTER